jgi:hypothetical protein
LVLVTNRYLGHHRWSHHGLSTWIVLTKGLTTVEGFRTFYDNLHTKLEPDAT